VVERQFSIRFGGQEVSLAEGETVLGRSRNCAIRIDDESVSRAHAAIEVREGAASIRDLGSSNGSFVNGKPVSGQTPLQNGDVIARGSAMLSVVERGAPEAEKKTTMIPPESVPAETRMITVTPAPAPPRVTGPTARRAVADVTIRDVMAAAAAAAPEEFPMPEAESRRRPDRPTRAPADVTIRDDFRDIARQGPAASAGNPPAPVSRRLIGALIDFVAVFLISIICFLPAAVAIFTRQSLRERGGSDPVFWILLLFCAGVALAADCIYFLSGWCGKGASFGQRLAGLRVETERGELLKSGAALIRFVIVGLYLATAGVLSLSVLFDREGKGLADRLSRSRVVASPSPAAALTEA
jgi:uncharacterized RDD family membrane protein YckC